MIGNFSYLKNMLLLENNCMYKQIDLRAKEVILEAEDISVAENCIRNSGLIYKRTITDYEWDEHWIKCKTEQYSPCLITGVFEVLK